MVGTIAPRIFLIIYLFLFLETNTIYAVRGPWLAILIFSKYLVLEFWLRNNFR